MKLACDIGECMALCVGDEAMGRAGVSRQAEMCLCSRVCMCVPESVRLCATPCVRLHVCVCVCVYWDCAIMFLSE